MRMLLSFLIFRDREQAKVTILRKITRHCGALLKLVIYCCQWERTNETIRVLSLLLLLLLLLIGRGDIRSTATDDSRSHSLETKSQKFFPTSRGTPSCFPCRGLPDERSSRKSAFHEQQHRFHNAVLQCEWKLGELCCQ